MRDEDKSKEQLLSELQTLRSKLTKLRTSAGLDRQETIRLSEEHDMALHESQRDLGVSRAATATSLEQLGIARENLRLSEETLADTSQRYSILGNLVPFGVWTSDPKGNVTYLSDSYLAMSGIRPDDSRLANWVGRLSPSEIGNAVSEWQSALGTMKIWEREHKATGTDGKQYTILSRGVPIADKDGKVLSWFGINLDISGRMPYSGFIKASRQ